ncbi:hypothetical protein EBL84_09200 [Marichromatium sp. AB31]|nr:hypothetical protein EBL84_09200 [Marichromatium sp. AB31]
MLGKTNRAVKDRLSPPIFQGVRLPYMKTTWNDRLRDALTAREKSPAELSRAVGVKPPTVHGWLHGGIKNLKGENLVRVCSYLHIRQEWLLYGRGEMEEQPRHEQPPATPANDPGDDPRLSELPAKYQAIIRLLEGFPQSEVDQLVHDLGEKKSYYDRLLKELLENRRAAG